MYFNIFLALILLVLTPYFLSKMFTLPRNIWLLFIAQPLVMAASPIIVFIGGILSTHMVDDPSMATLPVTMMILGVASASVPAAIIAKMKGRKFASYTGFSLALFAALIAAWSTMTLNFSLFVFASVLFGTSAAFVQQLRFAAIESANNPDDTPTVLSILMLSGLFAAFLGPEIAVAAKSLIESPHGYTGSFLVIALLIVIAMFAMSFFKNPTIKHQALEGEPRPLLTIVKQPIFIIAVLTAAIGYALMSYLMTATPLSMHHMQGHSLHETKWVIQSHIAAMFLPSLFTGWLVKKIGLNHLLLLGTFIYAIVAVVALSGQAVMHYGWALVLLGIGWNFLFLTGTSLLPQSYQANERHKVQAINDFLLFGMQATASLMAGWVLFKAGWHMVVYSSMPFVAALFFVAIYFYRHSNKNQFDSAVLDAK